MGFTDTVSEAFSQALPGVIQAAPKLLLLAVSVWAIRRAALEVLNLIQHAKPNEWLVVIRNGEQRTAGIGLKAFVSPLETCVTFPSVLTKVTFDAMQTTKEMQGVHVYGFAIFSVLRTGDGPFRYYKYIQGGGASAAQDSLKGMAEALLRKHVATTSLEEVLQDRAKLRDAVRAEMMETTKGWGVWMETFEIKEVMVCSKTLFEDMQAEFRNDTHVRAESVRLEAKRTMAIQKAKHQEEITLLQQRTDTANAKARQDTRTAVEKHEAESELQRAKTAAEVQAQQLVVEKQVLEAQRVLKEAQLQQEHDLCDMEQKLRRTREADTHAHKLDLRRADLAVDGEMSDKAMQKILIQSTTDIYKNMPLKEMSLHNFVSPEGASGGGLAGFLPGISAITKTIQDAK